jgi:hypothetical protein
MHTQPIAQPLPLTPGTGREETNGLRLRRALQIEASRTGRRPGHEAPRARDGDGSVPALDVVRSAPLSAAKPKESRRWLKPRVAYSQDVCKFALL